MDISKLANDNFGVIVSRDDMKIISTCLMMICVLMHGFMGDDLPTIPRARALAKEINRVLDKDE